MQSTTHAQNRFHGKTVLITGGYGEFGLNCGLRMAKEGANVAILGRNQEKLAEACEEV